ncbi:MAG: FkbM family methyltransferase [Verrucomicrobiaceae bacterium]|nr:FkbM family methyltransferase [Verrucomicrobiaceae bacterium]
MMRQLIEWARHKRFRRNIRQWFRERGDDTLRLNYALDASSVVFDVGGFEGDFAAAIHERYGCEVHVFEPVPAFFEALKARFAGNQRITLHPFGLGGRTESLPMSIEANGSSHVKETETEKTVSAQIISFEDFISESCISRVDLMKINIEGAEFDLLDHLIRHGRQSMIRDLQVQFHRFVRDASARRRDLRRRLAETHDLTYNFYFVWENWHLKRSP